MIITLGRDFNFKYQPSGAGDTLYVLQNILVTLYFSSGTCYMILITLYFGASVRRSSGRRSSGRLLAMT